MKIAIANNYYYLRGGSERVLFDDQAALQALGHEVRPFAQYDDKNHTASSAAFFPRIADPTAARGIDRVKAAIDIVYSSSAGKAFGAFLDDYQPDVLHCHNIYGHLTTAVLDEAKRRRIPTVLTVHDLKLVCPAYLGLRLGKPCQLCQDGGYWRCIRWKCHKDSYAASMVYATEAYFNRLGGKYDTVARFLCPSRFMQNSLVDSGIAEERTAYHPNALAPEDYAPCFEPGDYVLYVGRLSVEKGLPTLLSAFERMEIPLRIAGTGPLEAELQSRIQARGLRVQMEGYCAGERLATLYRNSAFTVLPSEWYENASMSVLESFAYGKPVLASDIGGNPELVIDGVSGRLFSSGSVEELADVAHEMWASRDELTNMGKRARGFIEQQFNRKRRISNLLSIYDDVSGRVSPKCP
jgi:glycosyltransferase involved in cell wall biosynthesis